MKKEVWLVGVGVDKNVLKRDSSVCSDSTENHRIALFQRLNRRTSDWDLNKVIKQSVKWTDIKLQLAAAGRVFRGSTRWI